MGNPSAEREPSPAGGRRFETTQWTLVLEAGDDDDRQAREALALLCQTYWQPVYAYLRARGFARQEAEDLTQGFFTRLIEKGTIGRARRERGRFRSFLLASLKHYVTNEWHRARAEKRGGGRPVVRLDSDAAERRLPREPAIRETPEDLFLKQWAFTLLDRVMASLDAEMRRTGRGEQFEVLGGFLTGRDDGLRYRDVAARLGATEGAVKVKVHRMRKRFGELLRQEVAAVVSTPGEVEDELAALLEAVAA
ncbi:MAG: sigma factor [Acidobacteriota bacterium]|jgi:RNA polymerase sigma-70 factor (ECF subfamily)